MLIGKYYANERKLLKYIFDFFVWLGTIVSKCGTNHTLLVYDLPLVNLLSS
jgi:hypothetical protein